MAKKRGQGEGSIFYLESKKLWCAKITIGYNENGKQKRKEFYGKTKKEVQEKMNVAKVDLDKGIYVEPSKITVAAWLDTWLIEYKKRNVRANSYRVLDEGTNRYIKPAIGKIALKDLRAEMIQKMINDISDRGISASTIERQVSSTINLALEQALANGLVTKNVAVKIVLPKQEKEEMRVLSAEEQERFIEVAKTKYFGDAYILMLGTGIRLGELLALEWGDIDFDMGMLSVNKTLVECYDYDAPVKKLRRRIGPPKTKSSYRDIPLLPNVLDMLKEKKSNAIDGINLLYPNDSGEYLTQSVAQQRLKRMLRAANIADVDKIHPHSLRHTFATRGLEQGIELIVMSRLLGHSSIKMTADLYTHVLPDKKASSILKLETTIKI